MLGTRDSKETVSKEEQSVRESMLRIEIEKKGAELFHLVMYLPLAVSVLFCCD